MPYRGGVVYEGGIQPNANTPQPDIYRFLDFRSLATSLNEMQVPFHMFGGDMTHAPYYVPLGAVCNPSASYAALIRLMSRYDWGFYGSTDPHPQITKTFPNKVFEYVAAGIPVITLNGGEAAEWVVANGVGIALEDIKELPERYDEHKQLKLNVLEKRDQFTAESQAPGLVRIYEELTGKMANEAAA